MFRFGPPPWEIPKEQAVLFDKLEIERKTYERDEFVYSYVSNLLANKKPVDKDEVEQAWQMHSAKVQATFVWLKEKRQQWETNLESIRDYWNFEWKQTGKRPEGLDPYTKEFTYGSWNKFLLVGEAAPNLQELRVIWETYLNAQRIAKNGPVFNKETLDKMWCDEVMKRYDAQTGYANVFRFGGIDIENKPRYRATRDKLVFATQILQEISAIVDTM